jgi:Tfp pilus assembly protein PilW
MRLKLSEQKGLTFVELILYVGVSSTILLVIVALFAVMLQTQIKQQAIATVEIEGQQAMRTMATAIRNSTTINSPAPATNASSISIGSYQSANDPTIFNVSQGTLQIKEGTSAPIALTSTQTVVKSLTFKNLTATGTPGAIQIILTLDHVNPTNNANYGYPQTFYTTATLRQP